MWHRFDLLFPSNQYTIKHKKALSKKFIKGIGNKVYGSVSTQNNKTNLLACLLWSSAQHRVMEYNTNTFLAARRYREEKCKDASL